MVNDYANSNWDHFRLILDEILPVNPKIKNIADLERKIQEFTDAAIDSATKLR